MNANKFEYVVWLDNPYASLPIVREGYVDKSSPIYYGGKTSKAKKKKK